MFMAILKKLVKICKNTSKQIVIQKNIEDYIIKNRKNLDFSIADISITGKNQNFFYKRYNSKNQ